jgi:hypothetical protein
MSRRVGSFEDLLAMLRDDDTPHRADAAAQIVELAARSGPFEGPVFARWERELPYVQIVAPMIHGVGDERVREVEDALCRLNHAVALAGFAYDFSKRTIYFRCTVPLDKGGVSAETLRRAILAAIGNARDFLLPLRSVVDGDAGARVLALVLEQERARRAARARDATSFFGD